ncbi:hypothetical protein [Olleya aquimaris]|uniref:Thrombospondin type 3 repeat-containing protein n=1 Tax=Olleya aquimaris TaxID=639310 RepID=A0A327RHF0_9FLAO|nr:hypothetical protein [Olleya aquimaris]RAJ16329.1 hypothetical protein LY08_01188 [Olleya aquimaris]
MRKLSVLFLFILSVLSCDDGDIITTELAFDDTFQACGDLVLYKVKTDPNETLSLQLSNANFTIADLIETEPISTGSLVYQLQANESTEFSVAGAFKYRSYTSDPSNFFCNDVPPNGIQITQEFTSTSGTGKFTMELVEDDNDGIPAEMEDINGNGDLYDDDTDGDGLPNFLDVDDDGDNVLTVTELTDFDDNDTDNDPLTDPEDTDGDGIPNYLDNDDDGDGVPTRNEEVNSFDNNPTNDITNPDFGPDYLNPDVSNDNPPTSFREHTIQQEFTVNLLLENIQFPEITYDETDFGTLTTVDGVDILNEVRTVTPPFN